MFAEQVQLIWKVAKRALIALGLILLFVVLIEIIQAYQILSTITPLLGWAFLLVVTGLIVWGARSIYRPFKIFPRAPRPPSPEQYIGDHFEDYHKAYIVYLSEFAGRLSENKNLSSEQQTRLARSMNGEAAFTPAASSQDLEKRIAAIDEQLITPALTELDEKAETIVRNCVRDTASAVILSPFRAADAFFVLYRNGAMFLRLVKLYNQRPDLFETRRIFFDVMKVVAAVNILSFTEHFTERLMAGIPLLERHTDDIIQGIGAGILTTAVGKATIQRCRAYSGWDFDEEISSYRKMTGEFLGYVKGILAKDVLPPLSKPWKKGWGYVTSVFAKRRSETHG